jgi:hypothetical protein
MLGMESTLMITVSLVEGHVPLEIVQEKLFAPAFIAVTPEEGAFTDVTEPDPLINVHAPIPIVGAFPASVVTEEQMV